MAEYKAVEPDLNFIDDVMNAGGDSLKKCYQCATCSVVCKLSPDQNPFPRKEMIWAQWGLADRFVGDSHVWLCHQCNDCSTNCPRGAKPGDTMGGIRSALIKRLATPKFLGEIIGDINFLPLLLIIPALLILGAMSLFHGIRIPLGEIEYGKFVAHESLYVLYGGGFGLMLLSMFLSGRKLWQAMVKDTAEPTGEITWIKAVIESAKEFLLHDRFRKCEESKVRTWGHMMVFYGFAGLFIVTSVVAPLAWLGLYPLSLFSPLKILGNIAGVLLTVGVILLIMDRADREVEEKHSYFDWMLLIQIIILAVTGMALMALRLLVHPEVVTYSYAALAYGIYFIHLWSVFIVILLLPFTKLAHMFYRFLAMVHAKMASIPTGSVS